MLVEVRATTRTPGDAVQEGLDGPSQLQGRAAVGIERDQVDASAADDLERLGPTIGCEHELDALDAPDCGGQDVAQQRILEPEQHAQRAAHLTACG